MILDVQAPGGKGANGIKEYGTAAEGGGGGAFCRLIINLDNTIDPDNPSKEKPYFVTIAACTTENDQSPNYSIIGFNGGKNIKLQAGYNGVTYRDQLNRLVFKAGEGGKIYIPDINVKIN